MTYTPPATRCYAVTYSKIRCAQGASMTRDGIGVCGNHATLFDEYRASLGGERARMRLLDGPASVHDLSADVAAHTAYLARRQATTTDEVFA